MRGKEQNTKKVKIIMRDKRLIGKWYNTHTYIYIYMCVCSSVQAAIFPILPLTIVLLPITVEIKSIKKVF